MTRVSGFSVQVSGSEGGSRAGLCAGHQKAAAEGCPPRQILTPETYLGLTPKIMGEVIMAADTSIL
jgi:hypothetical protein